jgi:hypothetical protein
LFTLKYGERYLLFSLGGKYEEINSGAFGNGLGIERLLKKTGG